MLMSQLADTIFTKKWLKMLFFSSNNELTRDCFLVMFLALCFLGGFLMKTYLPKIDKLNRTVDEQPRKWHLIDADGMVLGKVATKAADLLRGKNKPTFTPHLDTGDFVVVINAEKIVLTGQKETEKVMSTFSGWRGGQKRFTPADVRAKHPERLVERAVRGMIPRNRLGRQIFKKLKVYAGSDHPHKAQAPALLKLD
jgi:large subunit ribosomal protein L13|tara:strand:+ start:266 stop:856 length:591 start_codon:yes stop_codon:yes gene_type:complete